MVVLALFESKPAVAAGVGPRLVQVDVDLRMPLLEVGPVADGDVASHLDDRHLRNEVDGRKWLRLLGQVLADETHVVLEDLFT